MKKIKLGLVGALMLVLAWMLPVTALAQSETQTGVGFTPSKTVVVDAATLKSNHNIPNGSTAKQSATPKVTVSPDSLSGTLLKTLRSGRLPQTAEAYAWYIRICGGMVLLILILSYLIWRNLRLEDRGEYNAN
ncbi:hypothetical protein D1831_06885 [Lactiplantibacillus garii]|uniref:Cell surface protein n=1 Tax=Lactiplantibacillus garii TaxID=2306423 RepID=A0A426D7K9_9LACO|nr:hypothetical protein [Lactiplantibacillus garii]RRK10580.1 hypothetical protein D1831_06885 [Lactiplantibacillus garii]